MTTTMSSSSTTTSSKKITSKTTSSTITNEDDDVPAGTSTTTTKTSLFAGVHNGGDDDDVVVADESLLDELRAKILALRREGTDDTTKDDEDINYEVDYMLSGDDNDDDGKSNLCRLLLARSNNVEKAYEMGKSIIIWRSKMKPHQLSIQDFPTAHSQGVWRFAGYAKNGWGIIKIIAKNWSSFSYSVEEYCKMVTYYMEQNIRRCKNSAPEKKNFLIFDMKHMNYFSDIRKLRVLTKLTNDYYPERLGVAVIVNCDYVFDKLFHLMIKWVDTRTSKKAIDFRTNGSEYLLQHVDSDQLTIDLGGTRETEWPLE